MALEKGKAPGLADPVTAAAASGGAGDRRQDHADDREAMALGGIRGGCDQCGLAGERQSDTLGQHEHEDQRVPVLLDQMSNQIPHVLHASGCTPFNLGRAGAILPGDDN